MVYGSGVHLNTGLTSTLNTRNTHEVATCVVDFLTSWPHFMWQGSVAESVLVLVKNIHTTVLLVILPQKLGSRIFSHDRINSLAYLHENNIFVLHL